MNDNKESVQGLRFAMIPEEVLYSGVSPAAVMLYAVLNRYVGANDKAWPSKTTLAKKMNCSVPTVARAMKELETSGGIHIRYRFRDDGSQTSSDYWLWPRLPEGVSQVIGGGIKFEQGGVSKTTPLEGESVEGESVNTTSCVETTGYTEGFDDLWSTYPRKLNKSGAYKAYKAAIKRGAFWIDLAHSVDQYRKEVEGKDQEYIMHGSTFFGPNDRWKDYLPAPAMPLNTEAAFAYDEWDLTGVWSTADGDTYTDNPITCGLARPMNGDGTFIAADGSLYALDAAGCRVHPNYWGGVAT